MKYKVQHEELMLWQAKTDKIIKLVTKNNRMVQKDDELACLKYQVELYDHGLELINAFKLRHSWLKEQTYYEYMQKRLSELLIFMMTRYDFVENRRNFKYLVRNTNIHVTNFKQIDGTFPHHQIMFNKLRGLNGQHGFDANIAILELIAYVMEIHGFNLGDMLDLIQKSHGKRTLIRHYQYF